MLKFSPANTKLKKLYKKPYLKKWLNKKKIYSLDLLAGWSCPFALDCKSKVVSTESGYQIRDSPQCKFRCYAASIEALYTKVYKLHQHNFNTLRKTKCIVKCILESLPKDAGIIRWHSSGDFFSSRYFTAAIEVAKRRPDILFYGYTKALGFWCSHIDDIPSNMVLTASLGGKLDKLIDTYNLRSIKVVKSTYEARKLGLPVDSDDSHAANPNRKQQSFAIIIHGVQPAGTEYAKTVRNRW